MAQMDRSTAPHSDWAARFDALVNEVLVPIRAAKPSLSTEEIYELAVRAAAYRLAQQGFVWSEP
jgi:hypothetical protein